jgi:hypothetical protein
VEDDAEGVALAGANAADAVTQVDAVAAFSALDWPIVNGKQNGIALE